MKMCSIKISSGGVWVEISGSKLFMKREITRIIKIIKLYRKQ
jgi:hypothetical protein